MSENNYAYIIIGAGLAGASAIEGIWEIDKDKPVLLIGQEKHLPYDRPPLSKKLWLGKKRVEKIFLHDQKFYEDNSIVLALGTSAVSIDAGRKIVTDDKANTYSYGRLLIATGGTPRTIPIPGGNLEGISYFRYLDDYLRLRPQAAEGKSAVVIGGGFIGSEIAASLSVNKLDVTMIFPEGYLCNRVFPEYLGKAIQNRYLERGVKIINNDKPLSFAEKGGRFITSTGSGKEFESDLLVAGIGIAPEVKLAQSANLNTSNGVMVNEYLQTSSPDIYAAGDNAFFPYQALGKQARLEHWDNSINQGKLAGRNMAGAHEPYTYMPYFFSDLFEFGYEAVGEVNTELETFADWQKENDTGVIYYLKDGKVRGVMLCNVWKKVEAARQLIREGSVVSRENLGGAIR